MGLHPVDFLRRPDVSRVEEDDEQQQDVLVAVLGPIADLALDLFKSLQTLEVCLGEEEKIKVCEGVPLQLATANPVVQQLLLQFFNLRLAQQS